MRKFLAGFGRFWPRNWRFWVASGPTSSRASHQDDGSMPRKLPQMIIIIIAITTISIIVSITIFVDNSGLS